MLSWKTLKPYWPTLVMTGFTILVLLDFVLLVIMESLGVDTLEHYRYSVLSLPDRIAGALAVWPFLIIDDLTHGFLQRLGLVGTGWLNFPTTRGAVVFVIICTAIVIVLNYMVVRRRLQKEEQK